MRFALQLACCLAAFVLFIHAGHAADAPIDPNLIGTWQLRLSSTQSTDTVTFEIRTNGTYTTTLQNAQPAQREVGVFSGRNGQWNLRSVRRSDSGTYWFSTDHALQLKSRTGTSMWQRVTGIVSSATATSATNAGTSKAAILQQKPAPISPEAVAESERLLKLGLTYLDNEPKTAATYLEKAVAANPQNAEALGNLGLAIFKYSARHGGRVTAGLHYLYQCYELDLRLREKFERALVQEEVRIAAQSNGFGKHPDVPADKLKEIEAINLAAVTCTAGEKAVTENGDAAASLALAYFLRALEINPTYARARAGRGLAFYGYSSPEVGWSIFNLNAATRLDPNAAEPKRERGLIEMQLFLWDAAFEDFSLALQLQPNDLELRALHAVTATLAGHTAEVEVDKRQIRKLSVLNGEKIVAGIENQVKRLASAKNPTPKLADEFGGDLEEAREWERFLRARAAERALKDNNLRAALTIKLGGLIPDKYQ